MPPFYKKQLIFFLKLFFVFRTTRSSSKEAQKDVHRENGRNEKPVEEHRRPVCQLVSMLALRNLAGHIDINIKISGGINAMKENKSYACVEVMPVRAAILCSQDANLNLSDQ